MSVIRIKKNGLTVIGAAMDVFNVAKCQDINLYPFGMRVQTMRVTKKGESTDYDWWVEGENFCFLKAE